MSRSAPGDRTRFANWFNRQLLRWGMKQADFIRASGRTSGTVSAWSTGDRVPQDRESIEIIAETFQCPQRRVLIEAGYLTDEFDDLPEDDPRSQMCEMARVLDLSNPETNIRFGLLLESMRDTLRKQGNG